MKISPIHRIPGTLTGAGLIAAISVLVLPVFRAHADTGIQAWAQRYPELGAGGRAVAVDQSGNAIVTGTASARQDGVLGYTTIKYSSAGAPLWTNYCYAQQDDERELLAESVAVDHAGNAIVAGYSRGRPETPARQFTTVKYSSDGIPMWTNRYRCAGEPSQAGCQAVVDSNGNVILAAYSTGSIDSPGYLTIKYSSAGTALWTNHYAGAGNAFCRAVTADSSGSVIVTGESYADLGYYECVTVKYSATGEALWTNRYGLPRREASGNAVAVDSENNVIVTGYSDDISNDFLTIKYSSEGEALWTNRFGSQYFRDRAEAVAIDADGSVIITGYSEFYDDGSDCGYVTIKYSSAGLPLWTNYYNGGGYDAAMAVAVDGMGSVFVGGNSWSGNSSEYAIVKYSGTGVPLWTNRCAIEPFGNFCLGLGPDGSAYVTGHAAEGFETIKYISRPALEPLVLAGATNLLVTWTAVPNQVYRLESNTNLSTANWCAVTNVVALGARVSVNDVRVPSEPQKYYRVRSP